MRTHTADPEPWRLVTDWFWLAHDETSGRPRLNSTHLGLGLGSALLAELMISGYVVLDGDLVIPATRQEPPDVLARQVFALIAAEPKPLGVRMWLAYVSRTVSERVPRHLQSLGLVREHRYRLLRKTVFVPLDPSAAALPTSRMRSLLVGGETRWAGDPVLAAITEATGLLEAVVDPDEIRTARQSVPHVVQQLPGGLHTLVAHTRAASGAAVLAP